MASSIRFGFPAGEDPQENNTAKIARGHAGRLFFRLSYEDYIRICAKNKPPRRCFRGHQGKEFCQDCPIPAAILPFYHI
jgi:hypothetical protein